MERLQREIDEIKTDIERKKQRIKELKIKMRELKIKRQMEIVKQVHTIDSIPSLRIKIVNACKTGEWAECIQTLYENLSEDSILYTQLQSLNRHNYIKLPVYCVEKGYVDLIQELLKNGLNINEIFNDDTMLHEAARCGHRDLVNFLLLHGANIEFRGRGGYTPLHCAASHSYIDIITLLLECGADVNATDNHGNTALHDAAWRGNMLVAQCLLDGDCDSRIKNDEGKTVLDVALEKGHIDIVKILFEI